jgi:hypothetical protein
VKDEIVDRKLAGDDERLVNNFENFDGKLATNQGTDLGPGDTLKLTASPATPRSPIRTSRSKARAGSTQAAPLRATSISSETKHKDGSSRPVLVLSRS